MGPVYNSNIEKTHSTRTGQYCFQWTNQRSVGFRYPSVLAPSSVRNDLINVHKMDGVCRVLTMPKCPAELYFVTVIASDVTEPLEGRAQRTGSEWSGTENRRWVGYGKTGGEWSGTENWRWVGHRELAMGRAQRTGGEWSGTENGW